MLSNEQSKTKLDRLNSDVVLSDTHNCMAGEVACAMRLGTSEGGLPVVYMGEINNSKSVAMYIDKTNLERLKLWINVQLCYEEGTHV